MNGTLYYDEIEKQWYVNWLYKLETMPGAALSGRHKVCAESAVSIELRGLSSGDSVLYIEEEEYARIINSADDLSLYSQIEHLIIKWNIDGTKTAGHLTRQIMKLIEKQK
jgi:hypothetical protein